MSKAANAGGFKFPKGGKKSRLIRHPETPESPRQVDAMSITSSTYITINTSQHVGCLQEIHSQQTTQDATYESSLGR